MNRHTFLRAATGCAVATPVTVIKLPVAAGEHWYVKTRIDYRWNAVFLEHYRKDPV